MDLKDIGKKMDKMDKMLHCIDKNLAVTKNNVKRINGSVAKNTKKVDKLENQLISVTAKITVFVSFIAFILSTSGSLIWKKLIGT